MPAKASNTRIAAGNLENRQIRQRGNKPATKAQQRESSLLRILQSALHIFVRKGYNAATVDDIAKASALTKGAVYFYFPSKSAVLLALFDQIEEVLVRGALDSMDQAGPRQADKLIAYLHSGAGLGNDKPDLVLLYILMLLEFNGQGDELEQRIKGLYGAIAARVQEVVERGQLEGEFRRDLAARELASIVMALFNGTFMEWYCRPKLLDGPSLVKAARVTALDGLLSEPTRSRKR